uniref:Fibronectin type-II domain-containing protein n=1 Tax=Steinernema glaseri TaxID=37863 RepID=A0A1I7ZJW9_9BILA
MKHTDVVISQGLTEVVSLEPGSCSATSMSVNLLPRLWNRSQSRCASRHLWWQIVVILNYVCPDSPASARSRVRPGHGLLKSDLVETTTGPPTMKIKVLAFVSLALLLAAPLAAEKEPTYRLRDPYTEMMDRPPCYKTSDAQCNTGYYTTDVWDDGSQKTLMCCNEPSKFKDKSVCKERFLLTWGCPDGHSRNDKWFNSGFWRKWCCPNAQHRWEDPGVRCSGVMIFIVGGPVVVSTRSLLSRPRPGGSSFRQMLEESDKMLRELSDHFPVGASDQDKGAKDQDFEFGKEEVSFFKKSDFKVVILNYVCPDSPASARSRIRPGHGLLKSDRVETTVGLPTMKTKALVLVSLALLLVAPLAAEKEPTYRLRNPEIERLDLPPCYKTTDRCDPSYHTTDVWVDGSQKTLMCCDKPSKFKDRSVCEERFYFTWGCHDGQEVNDKWFNTAFWYKWCCPYPKQ